MPLGTLRQEDFSAGEQRDVSPHLIDPRGVFSLLNGLLNDDGSVYKRGGSKKVSTGTLGAHARMVWNGWTVPGRRTLMGSTDRFGVLAEDGKTLIDLGGTGVQQPAPAVQVQGILFIGGGTMYGGSRKAADYLAGTAEVTNGSTIVKGAGTAWLANVDPGMLLRVGSEGRVYVVAAVTSDTQLSIRDAYEAGSGAGKSYTLKRLESAGGAPYKSAPIYTQAAQRLIVCNGNVVDFSESKKPHLYQATINTPGGPVVVDNRHEIEEGVTIVAAASLGVEKGLVFHTGGVTTISNLGASIVDANGNGQHRIDTVSTDIVAWGSAGIAGYRNALVVPALDDVYIFDGVSQPIPLSHSIDPLYQAYVNEGYVPGQSWVYRDHFFLPILDSGGDPIDLLACRLDRPFDSRGRTFYPWNTLAGAGARVSGADVQSAVGANDRPHVYAACNDGSLLDLATFFEPGAPVKADHDGTVPVFSLTTRDFPAGDLSIGRFRRFRLIYELETAEQEETFLTPEEPPFEGEEDEGVGEKEDETAQINLEVGTGIRKETKSIWDLVEWDEFEWAASDEESQFVLLPGGAPPNAGPDSQFAQNAKDWWLNTHARYARFRLVSADAVAKLTIRTIEIFVAETGGVRQAKVVDD